MAKQVHTHILEKTIGTLMGIFGVAALYIFFVALQDTALAQDVAVIQILIILVLAILAQTIVLIRIYENTQK